MPYRIRASEFLGAWPLFIGIAYFLLATTTLLLTQGTDGIATVWPASGISIAGLLLARKDHRPTILLAVALGSMGANLLGGLSLDFAAAFTLANLFEAVVGYFCIRHINRDSETIYNPLSVVEFCLAALLTGTLSAAVATLLTGGGLDIMFISWATTVGLGIMIVVPLVLNLVLQFSSVGALQKVAWRVPALIFTLVAASTYLVFQQTSYPLLFLPLMTVIVATYLLGPNGAMVSILIIAVIATNKTLDDLGPIHLMRQQGTTATTLFLQFYLLVLLLSALPLAALLNARERVLEQVTRSKRWLEMSEHFAHVGHWRLDLMHNQIFWSDEVFYIHGLEPGPPPPLETAIDYYHPEDRAMVQAHIDKTFRTNRPFEFEARLITAKGQERYVCSRGELERNAKGEPIALFGIFQDVTERALANKRLAQARERAEEQADYAMVLAQTDPLTGIANRRNSLEILTKELAKAREEGAALSLAILDIDHFKSINDKYGHAVGDIVIRKTANLCANAIRGSDLAGRIGGEEFLLILPGADTATAMAIGERVRQAIESARWSEPGPYRVTASIGLATLDADAEPPTNAEALLAEADAALYQAKRDGRNLLRAA